MSTTLDPAHLSRLVVGGGLLLGLALGAVGQATRFCVRGALADWVIFRGPARLVSWLLAVAVGAVAVQGLISAGAFDASRTLAWSERFLWLSYLVGGAIFGFGMMLAGGCPQRSLVKAGSGNLKSLIVLVIAAIAALMTLRGAFASWRVEGLDRWSVSLSGPQDLGSFLFRAASLPAEAVRWGLVLALLAGVLGLAWRVRAVLDRGHWLGGIVVGLLVAGAFLVTGQLGFLAEHPETLEPAWMGTQSRRPEGLSFAAPLAHGLDLLTLWTDKNTVATFGVMLALGVLAGSFASARLRGEFHLESFQTPRELGLHVAGGVLMGFGGITAAGCSIGQGVTGLAMLSLGAVLAVTGMAAGAWCALRLMQLREGKPGTAGTAAAPAHPQAQC